MTNQTEIETATRQEWMGLLARAPEEAMLALWNGLSDRPHFDWLRRPEVGGVMVRGRAGSTGAPFNLGEMTVTRCSVVLDDGTVGHGYVQGRSKPKAAAVMSRSMGYGVPARAAAPNGLSFIRSRQSLIRARSLANISAYASIWCPNVTGCADCKWVKPGMIVSMLFSA